MSEYWLISAPGDKTCQQTWESMNNVTSKQNNLCENFKFHIPDLKVGTLDQLVGLSDDLGKLDTYVEQTTRKIATYLGDVLEDQRDKLYENLQANNSPGPPEEESLSVPSTPSAAASDDADVPSLHASTKLVGTRGGSFQHQGSSSHGTASSSYHGSLTSSSLGSDREADRPCTCSRRDLSSPEPPTIVCSDNSCSDTPGACCSEKLNCRRQKRNNSSSYQLFASDDSNADGHDDALDTAHHDRESAFDWWFHRRKSPNKSRSRSSSHILGGGSGNGTGYTTSGTTIRSSPVSSCCGGSHGRSSPELDQEIYGANLSTVGHCPVTARNGLATSTSMQQLQQHPMPPQVPISLDDLTAYITRFQWDLAKYPTKQSLRNIADIISKQVGQIDADLKTKSAAYNNLKGNLQNLEKKQTGSLLTRNLADLVKKEHFILDSEYLTTLLVIVPKVMVNDWNVHYEKITDMIVPRSSQIISQDTDYALCTVTLFKKVVDEFKLHARERKFVVREFVYNEEELAAGKNEITKLVTDKKKQFGPLVRWLKVNFSECFCAWVHVKALRVFVESVLRYGLPVNFQAILIHPNKKSTKRLRDVLQQLYGHLDGSAGSTGGNADTVDIPGLGFGQSEYFPYVYYKLNVDMVESKV